MFLSFYNNTVFFFCSFFSVSLSFSLASFIFPFSLSLSIYLVSCFLFPCFLVSSIISVFCFINYFCFLGFPVLFCLSNPFFFSFVYFVLSVVCFGQHKCFQFSKKTISKTPSFVLRIVQSYRFLLRADLGAHLVDVRKKTVKIGISAQD